MKVNFDYNYIAESGYFVVLTSHRGDTFIGYVEDQNNHYKMIDKCTWNLEGKELTGKTEHNLKEVAAE